MGWSAETMGQSPYNSERQERCGHRHSCQSSQLFISCWADSPERMRMGPRTHQCAPSIPQGAWHCADVLDKNGVAQSLNAGPCGQHCHLCTEPPKCCFLEAARSGGSTAPGVWRPGAVCVHPFTEHSQTWQAMSWVLQGTGAKKTQPTSLCGRETQPKDKHIVDWTKGCPGEEAAYSPGPRAQGPKARPWSCF